MGSVKKAVLIVASLVLLGAGLVVGVILVRQRQLIRKEAAVPEGVAQVWLSPDQQSVNVGESMNVDVMFSTGGKTISGVQILLSYSYEGGEPPLLIANPISDIQLNSAEGFADSGQWSFPVRNFTASGGVAKIELGGVNVTAEGYSTDGAVLATLRFRAESAGSITVSFDSVESIITEKSTAEDILLIPTSVGNYSVQAEAAATLTPTPEVLVETSTPTMTPTPTSTSTPTPTSTSTPTPTRSGTGGDTTSTPTATPTRAPTNTPTPTATLQAQQTPTPTKAQLPDAGVGMPTYVMIVFGLLMVVGGILLFVI